jgi:hypothetical protein
MFTEVEWFECTKDLIINEDFRSIFELWDDVDYHYSEYSEMVNDVK